MGGSLTLNPNVGLPPYLTAVDIHCMPGNYTTELAEDDVFAGALYDRGVYVYFMGGLGSYNQVVGEQLLAYINQSQPGFQPKRILDMGCSVGHSTLPYTAAYPEAEIHAIDVGAAMLRYAHGRAESLGCKVHFSQQNAEHTDFADESFDLVVSHIMMHETSNRAIRNIMQESRSRRLKSRVRSHHPLLLDDSPDRHHHSRPRAPFDRSFDRTQVWAGLGSRRLIPARRSRRDS